MSEHDRPRDIMACLRDQTKPQRGKHQSESLCGEQRHGPGPDFIWRHGRERRRADFKRRHVEVMQVRPKPVARPSTRSPVPARNSRPPRREFATLLMRFAAVRRIEPGEGRWLRPSPLIGRPSHACHPTAIQKSATVSASALGLHLDCSRTYIGKLEPEGVIQRQGHGFQLDQSRIAYLRYLRRERRQLPRSEADADFQRAKLEPRGLNFGVA
jgi:hypothetical protein